jgi:predicted phosphodiesterase
LRWQDTVRQLKADGKSLTEISSEISPLFPELTGHQVWEKVHGVTRGRRKMEKPDGVIGVFSDPHVPFQHPNYLQFCKDTFAKYKANRVVCCGDLVDFHAISRHQAETCAKSPCDELDMTIDGVKSFTKAFPEVDLIIGNHDDRYLQQAATVGIDKRFLKPFSELFELPKGWRIHSDELIIGNVLYKHGINCTGKNGALNAALLERMSMVIGHSHSFGGCQYSANPRSIIFGLNAGCGIDIDAYAFAYGKHSKYRPTLGCGIVFSDTSAIFVPMCKEYFRG